MKPMIQRILVPTDFSPASTAAVDYAAALAESLWASVHLVHVLEEPFVTQGPWEMYIPDTPAVRERRLRDADYRLATVAKRFENHCARVTTEVRTGTPTRDVVTAADDYRADLVVMGTHGRSGLSHLMYGSVAERVIRTARCPVLAVRDLRNESARDAKVA